MASQNLLLIFKSNIMYKPVIYRLARDFELIFNILEAKNQLSQLVRRALAGEEIVIANRGRPLARLVPLEPPEQPQGLAAWLTSHPLPARAQRSADEIDAQITRERDAWE